MPCIATRLMVAAFAVYAAASFVHDQTVTWIVVAGSVVAVLAWSRRRRRGESAVPLMDASAPVADNQISLMEESARWHRQRVQ